MADFNWQTEEETSWGEIVSGPQEKVEKNGRNWLPFLLVVLAVVLVSGFLMRQARTRVGGAEEARSDDIVAANNLLVYAADQHDTSILLNILPVENTPWTLFQRALLDQELLLGRWPLGLHRAEQEPVIKEIALSTDLQTADVLLEVPYETFHQGQVETVRLERTYHYEFRSEWRWIEPDSDFWGGLTNGLYDSGPFTALYPVRDEALVKRVVDDLPALLDDMCGQDDQPDCGFALDLLIHFEKEPAMLLDLAQRIEENGSYIPRLSPSSLRSHVIFLPTPSLVGLPVDEASYQALLRGYASHIFSAVMAELYQDECCPDDLDFPVFLEGEMAKRGIGFWPPPAVRQELLAHTAETPLPDRDIALLCTTGQRQRLALYRFNPLSGSLTPQMANRNIIDIRSAPTGQGILAQEAEFNGDEVLTRILYWHNQTARILYEETLPETVFAALRWQVQEKEARLVVVVPDLDNRVTTFVLVGLADCASGTCPKAVSELIGSPIWSPDGSQFLVKSGNILWWRQLENERVEQEPLGLGTAPFWIDNQTFGFVRTLEERNQEIVIAQPGDEEPPAALTSERLRQLIPAEHRPEQLMLGYVGVTGGGSTTSPERWIIMGFDWLSNGSLGEAFVFSYDRRVDGLSVLIQSENLHSFNLSPNGRWLAASLYDNTLAAWRLKIEPTAEGDDVVLLPWQANDQDDPPGYGWTADSEWLLILHQGMLSLYTPGLEAAQLSPPPIPGCVQAEWM